MGRLPTEVIEAGSNAPCKEGLSVDSRLAQARRCESGPRQIVPNHQRWREKQIVVFGLLHLPEQPAQCFGRKEQQQQALREDQPSDQRNDHGQRAA